MNVVGYIRVSLDCAVTDFLDRDTQGESIRLWAHERNHRLVAVFCDEGVNASSGLETRLGLGDALQTLRTKEASGVVVARLDRLALSVVQVGEVGLGRGDGHLDRS